MDAALRILPATFSKKEWADMERQIAVSAKTGTERWRRLYFAILAVWLVAGALGAAFGRAGGVVYQLPVMLLLFDSIFLRPERARRAIERAARGERLAIVDEIRKQHLRGAAVAAFFGVILAGYAAAFALGLPLAGVADPGMRAGVAAVVGMLAAVFVGLAVKIVIHVRELDRKSAR